MADARALLPLVNQLGYPTTEENLIARIALYQQSPFDRSWIAIQNEQIIGCIALHLYDLFHSTERYARIVSLIVRDTHRRQGIGKKLIARAERYALRKNCSSLEKYKLNEFFLVKLNNRVKLLNLAQRVQQSQGWRRVLHDKKLSQGIF